MSYDVKYIELTDEFKVCPSCGYEDGFHSMFRRYGREIRWFFICPDCHNVFDIGFKIP
jgi:hypothetical protein